MHENQRIIVNDVTYIIYLFVITNYRTKKIESWELSMYNDAKLTIDSFVTIKDKLAGSIVRTDHGADNSSKL